MPKKKPTKSVFGPKKKRKQNFNNKQVQIIKTRLIQISMRMEDYVYQKMPISELEAERFISEVSSYKSECSKDERSLQVIEKLTRCMRAIIAEHQELRSKNSMSNDEQCYNDDRTCTASPVYSLPDEDRTQLTQGYTQNYINIEQHTVTADNNEASEIIDVCDDDADNENDITVKMPKNKLNSVMRTENNADVVINNALSNLSIRETSVDCMVTECSQSILNNYQGSQNVQQNQQSTGHDTREYSKIVEHAGRVLENNKNLLYQMPVANTTSNPAIKNLSNETARADNSVYNLNHPLVAKVSKVINNTFGSSRKLASMEINKDHTPAANTIENDNNMTLQQNQTTVINNKVLNNKTCNNYKRQEVLKTAKIINDDTHVPAIIKKKRCRRKKKSTEPKSTKDNRKLCIEHLTEQSLNDKKNRKTTQTVAKKKYARNKMNNENNGHNKKSPIPIYNKNVENDLSWLENIRYVREIGEDEYDKLSNLTDNFWDNCLLPPHFGEGDFD